MSSYRRFVTYVYRFVEGKKGTNCGFVKVEARNGVCTFYFRLQGLKIQGPCQLMAFMRKGNDYDFVLIGQGTVSGGLLQQRVDADRHHMGGSPYTLEQCAGLLCTGEGEEYYGTSWDQVGNVPIWVWEPNKKQEQEVESEPGADTQMEQVKKPDMDLEPQEVPESGEEPKPQEVPESGEELRPQEVPESGEELKPQEVPESGEELKPQEIPESVEELKPQEIPESGEELTLQDIPETGLQMTAKPEPKPECDAVPEDEAETDCAYNSDPDPELSSKPQPQLRGQEKKLRTFEEVWGHMQENFPCMEPFEDGGVVEGIKISPGDIPYLQEQKWNLGSNQFLLHGYKNYHHLMLGRVEGQNRYILGVPGVFDRQEQFMAKMFGFPCFKPVHSCRSRMGQFGYWFRCIC